MCAFFHVNKNQEVLQQQQHVAHQVVSEKKKDVTSFIDL